MDINELMIGDWASLKYFDSITGKKVVKDFQVTSVITNSSWNHRAVWSPEGNMGHEHIEGIRLTPAMLEKNGWYNDEIGGYWYHNEAMTILGHYTPPFTAFDGVTLTYVHQLQQALRLCGLTELANGFKV